MRLIGKYAFYFSCIVWAAFTVSCSSDVTDLSGMIYGTVKDARTSEPLSEVSVKVLPVGTVTTTGTDGTYKITVDAADYTVQATKDGYQSDKQTISLGVGEEKPLNFMLYPSAPLMNVSTRAIDFGSEATTLSFDILNEGYADLRWSISEDITWLSCNPASGVIHSGGKSSVVLSVSRDGLENKDYTQTFSITSNGGGSIDVTVSLSVGGSAIKVTPTELDFGTTNSVETLTLKNTGSGSTKYLLRESNQWIKLDKKSGTLSANSTDQIVVSVDRSEKSEGTYSGHITMEADGHQTEIPVSMLIVASAKPTVQMNGVSNETYSSAVFKAAVISVGSAKVLRHGFCWGTSENPTVENAKFCNFGDLEQPKDFDHTATGLQQNTRYYVRAYAENVEGMTYSSQLKFITPGVPTKATVSTGNATNVRANQADVTGVIEKMGNVEVVSQHGHVWSTKSNPTINDNKTMLGKTWSTGSFTSTLTGLQPHVTYHVRAYATNSEGTAYGEDVALTTDYATVELQTTSVTETTSKTAKSGGKIVDKGGHTVVERGVCWSTSGTPTVSGSKAVASTSNDTYSVTLTGLKAETAYYVRAYVKTQSGAVYYGDAVYFTTPSKEVDVEIGDFDDEDDYWHK